MASVKAWIGAALMLTGATSCGASSGSAGTPSPSPGRPTTTAAPIATPAAQALGTTITTLGGDTFTVLAFQPVQAKGQLNTPAPGGAFSAADIKECAGSGQTVTTDPTEWTVDFSGNNQAQGRDASLVATPGAALPSLTTVSSGQCVDGWIAFTGFADGIARDIHLNGLASWWAVP